MHSLISKALAVVFPMRYGGLVVLALALLHPLRGAFELGPDMPVVAPLGEFKVLEDTDRDIPVPAVITGQLNADFQPLPSGRTSLGITDLPWWMRFEAVNHTEEPVEWVMNIPFSITDEVDFYVVTAGEEVASYELGDKRPLANRPLAGEGFAIPVTTPAGETTVVYVRLLNRLGDGLDLFAEVSSPQAYYQNQLKVWIFYGIVVGGIVILLLYNAVVYTVVRDENYLWYLLYLCCALTTFLSISGFVSHYLWTHEGTLTEFIPPLFSSLTFIFVLQFSRKFLETKQRVPRLDWLLRGLMVYFVLPPVAFLLGGSALAAKMIMVGCLGLSILPVISAYIWWEGHRAALIFTLGWGIWFVSIGMMAGRIMGLVPSNDFSLRIGWIGILGEAILFALALAYRIRRLQAEKAAAEERERAALLRSKEELEALVRERTKELSIMNSEKDKLFSIIAHDLRNPFNGVIGLAEALCVGIHDMSRTEVDSCLRDLHSSATHLYKLLENLLSWALLQRGGMTYKPEQVELDPLVEQCLAIYQQAAQQKQLSVRKNGAAGITVTADPRMLATVVRNLISNAIKYSHDGDIVSIETRQRNGSVEIIVRDEGVGIDGDSLDKLFVLGEKTSAPGTHDESGTGLGLQLCKELIDTHGGSLSVESRPGKGATFTVQLKR